MTQEKCLNFRHELKYYINMADYMMIRQRLGTIAVSDVHGGEEGKYRIRSLYFETPGDKALREKLYGVNDREKFRIRFYNDDLTFIRLEKKIKRQGLGCKLSARVSKDDCERLLAGDSDWMRQSKDALLIELYAKMKYQQLKPKTIVDYMREPFVFEPGNVRITLDSEIRTGVHSTDLFNEKLPTVRANAGNVIILEVKYDEFLPAVIQNAVQIKNRKSTAFSKYAVARMYG